VQRIGKVRHEGGLYTEAFQRALHDTDVSLDEGVGGER